MARASGIFSAGCQPPSGRPVGRGAIDGHVDAEPRVERDDRPVAAECEAAAAAGDAVIAPAAGRALGADVRLPDANLIRGRVGVEWLQRRDHAERAEARDVGGVDGLDVLDAMAAWHASGAGLTVAACS